MESGGLMFSPEQEYWEGICLLLANAVLVISILWFVIFQIDNVWGYLRKRIDNETNNNIIKNLKIGKFLRYVFIISSLFVVRV